MRKSHNKLVRDKISDIIKKNGDTARTHVASTEEYWLALLAKLEEEVRECIAANGSLEELADILEVIEAMAEYRGTEIEEVRRLQAEKKQSRGGFTARIILEATE